MTNPNQTPRIDRMLREIELSVQPEIKSPARAQPPRRGSPNKQQRGLAQAASAATASKLLDRITLLATALAGFVALCLLASTLASSPPRNTAELLTLPIAAAHAAAPATAPDAASPARATPRADPSVPSATSVFSSRAAATESTAPSF
jgi:hypothetical protein